MISADEIRVCLADYVLGKIPLEDFENWFVSRSWNVHQIGDQSLQALVFEIKSRLSEYSGGHIIESVLLEKLAPLAKQYSVEIRTGELEGMVKSHTGASVTIATQGEIRIACVDIRPSMVFA